MPIAEVTIFFYILALHSSSYPSQTVNFLRTKCNIFIFASSEPSLAQHICARSICNKAPRLHHQVPPLVLPEMGLGQGQGPM